MRKCIVLLMYFSSIILVACNQSKSSNEPIKNTQQETKNVTNNLQITTEQIKKDLIFNKLGINEIKYGTPIDDVSIQLNNLGYKNHKEDNLSSVYPLKISLKDITLYNIPINELRLEFGKNNDLKVVNIYTVKSSWDNTAKYASVLKDKLSDLYGKPSKVNKISEEYYSKNDSINQEYSKWPFNHDKYVSCMIYKSSGGYDAGFFITTNIEKGKQTTNSSLTKAGKRIQAMHPDWDDYICNAVGSGNINIGMTKAQVSAAWGRPKSVNTTTNAYGSREQWVYGMKSYVYFENGTCTTIQN